MLNVSRNSFGSGVRISPYQEEQLIALIYLLNHNTTISWTERRMLENLIFDYLAFRNEVTAFNACYLSKICTETCFLNHLSACCNREAIITFFADVVVNALVSNDNEATMLSESLKLPNQGSKCVYLGKSGCLWKEKPIVCEMFLCDTARKKAFDEHPEALESWKNLKQREKLFKWPDRLVLFDELEKYFMAVGFSSPLMYLHNSPGLLRVKQQAGLIGSPLRQKNKKKQ